jgi:hypothetical protein
MSKKLILFGALETRIILNYFIAIIKLYANIEFAMRWSI